MAATVHSPASRLPVLTWIPGDQRAWLSRDAVAGLAAGAVVIPQAMAYASIAGLPAQFGLYTCMVPMAVYVLIGGSRAIAGMQQGTLRTVEQRRRWRTRVAAGAVDSTPIAALPTFRTGR